MPKVSEESDPRFLLRTKKEGKRLPLWLGRENAESFFIFFLKCSLCALPCVHKVVNPYWIMNLENLINDFFSSLLIHDYILFSFGT